MTLLEEAGINAFGVLAAATLNPTKALGLDCNDEKVKLAFKEYL
jgi:hypothetical protein